MGGREPRGLRHAPELLVLAVEGHGHERLVAGHRDCDGARGARPSVSGGGRTASGEKRHGGEGGRDAAAVGGLTPRLGEGGGGRCGRGVGGEGSGVPADRAPDPASRFGSSAGSSEVRSRGQLERAASSSRVCFLLGCCQRSGCVLASYARRCESSAPIATPSGVSACCTSSKSGPNSAWRPLRVSAPASSPK